MKATQFESEKNMSGIFMRSSPSGHNNGEQRYRLVMQNNGSPLVGVSASSHAYCQSLERAEVEARQMLTRRKDGKLVCDEVLIFNNRTGDPVSNFAREC